MTLSKGDTLLKLFLPVVVLAIVSSIVTRMYVGFRHLKEIPGPTWAPYSRFWLVKTLASGDSAQRFLEVNKKYGAHIHNNFIVNNDIANNNCMWILF